MNEQDFDKRIRETAMRQDAQIETPLWNKNGTWNRVESGLGKRDRTIWWKVAAIVILFFSIGVSYAQWERFSNFRTEKETELRELKQQINSLAADQQKLKDGTQILLHQKSAAIDSLKNQLLLIKTTGQRNETRKAALLQRNLSALLQRHNNDQDLIDSLKNNIQQLQAAAQKTVSSQKQEEKAEMKQKPETPETEAAPERQIYYITNHFQPKSPKESKGLKIGIFGSPENKEVEYQSDYSIFKNDNHDNN